MCLQASSGVNGLRFYTFVCLLYISDDIIVYGGTQDEHDANLKAVLTQLRPYDKSLASAVGIIKILYLTYIEVIGYHMVIGDPSLVPFLSSRT